MASTLSSTHRIIRAARWAVWGLTLVSLIGRFNFPDHSFAHRVCSVLFLILLIAQGPLIFFDFRIKRQIDQQHIGIR